MFLSIIVPIYNAETKLPKCIESVICQEETCWELLLIDDGSTDKSADVCKQYAQQDSRIKLIQIPNQGVSHARNIGLDNASGEYVYFLDADDWLSVNALTDVKKMTDSSTADSIFTSFYKEYATKTEFVPVSLGNDTPNPYHTRLLGTVWSKLYRKEFIASHRFNEELHLCEDAEFNYRLLPQAKTILYCETPTYHYVYYGNSAVRGYQPQRIAQYKQSLTQISAHINPNNAQMRDSATTFTCNVFCVIVMNNLFSRNHHAPLKEKFKTLWSLVNDSLFYPALKAVDSKNISKQQYIFIRLCLAKLTPAIWLMTELNHLRNKFLNY